MLFVFLLIFWTRLQCAWCCVQMFLAANHILWLIHINHSALFTWYVTVYDHKNCEICARFIKSCEICLKIIMVDAKYWRKFILLRERSLNIFENCYLKQLFGFHVSNIFMIICNILSTINYNMQNLKESFLTYIIKGKLRSFKKSFRMSKLRQNSVLFRSLHLKFKYII